MIDKPMSLFGAYARLFLFLAFLLEMPKMIPLKDIIRMPSLARIAPETLVNIPQGRAPSASTRGTASWYSESDPYIQWRTANGEVFDDSDLTCASWHLPMGTYVKVTNIKNGKYVICRVNDRGPRTSLNRAIDLTKASFAKIADPKIGIADVTITPVYRKPDLTG